jgi:acyl-CoA thioesterase-1
MNWVVFQIVAGRAFFAAVGLLAAATLLRSASVPRATRVSTRLLLAGLVALSVSAAPLPYWAYVLVGCATVGGSFADRFGKYAMVVSATGVLVLVAVALHEATYQLVPVLRKAPSRRIAVIGDSITAGYGSDDRTLKWPAILRDRHGVAVEDLARAGETAASAARHLRERSIDAPVLIVEIGGNDLIGGGSVQAFEEGLDALLRATCRPGRQVAMFELPIPPFYERFGRVQRELASRHGVALIPKRILLSVVGAAEATVDSIHLSQQGHERMAGVVWAILEPALPESSGGAGPTAATDPG